MSDENIFEFPTADSAGDGAQTIPSIATFTQQSPTEITGKRCREITVFCQLKNRVFWRCMHAVQCKKE